MYDAVIVPIDTSQPAEAALDVADVVADAFGCAVETVSFEVDPVGSILELMDDRSGALVCMPTSAHVGLGEVLLGSTAYGVVRETRHPVLLVGPEAVAPKRIETIVACVDQSCASTRAADTASLWALMVRADLHVVRVAPAGEPGDPHDSTVDLQRIAAGARRCGGAHVTWEVLHGDDVSRLVNAYAADVDASMLVVTPHGAGAAHRVLGSSAMRIVRDARIPVLVSPSLTA